VEKKKKVQWNSFSTERSNAEDKKKDEETHPVRKNGITEIIQTRRLARPKEKSSRDHNFRNRRSQRRRYR